MHATPVTHQFTRQSVQYGLSQLSWMKWHGLGSIKVICMYIRVASNRDIKQHCIITSCPSAKCKVAMWVFVSQIIKREPDVGKRVMGDHGSYQWQNNMMWHSVQGTFRVYASLSSKLSYLLMKSAIRPIPYLQMGLCSGLRSAEYIWHT